MSAARGNANQSHYLASLLLSAWACDEREQGTPAAVLAQAYLPAVREHLITAYGWFLLEIAGINDWPGGPPRSVQSLPEVPQGKAVAGELREFDSLERSGWLNDLLAEIDLKSAPVRSRGNLAQPVADVPGPGDAQAWHTELGAVMARMRDSLDEY